VDGCGSLRRSPTVIDSISEQHRRCLVVNSYLANHLSSLKIPRVDDDDDSCVSAIITSGIPRVVEKKERSGGQMS